jgi:hypothetical protein
MPNGLGLLDQSSSQTLVIKKPASASEYYLFAVSCQVGEFSSGTGVSYSIVDMSLDNGYGDVVASSKNTVLLDSTAEKITSVFHANGVDVWVLVHKWNSGCFLHRVGSPRR